MNDRSFKRAFDIGEMPDKIDLDVPPSTGFDYLYRVRLETRKCPKVVVSTIDTSQFLDRQTLCVDVYNGFVRARPGFEPDASWQKEQLERFQNLRAKLAEDKDMLKKQCKRSDFPRISKVEEWCQYCLGAATHSSIYLSETDNPGSPSKSKKSRFADSSGNAPLISIVIHMSQQIVTRLLTYHATWLESTGFSHVQGQWLYALLMCLEKPLDPDTCAFLRSLSRLCSKMRGELPSPENEFVKPLNLILCIVAQYFDQKDMSDQFCDIP